MSIKVFNEVGKLKKVMLHRPFDELLNLVPEVLEELLFDDIPGYHESQKEHDEFAEIFRSEGVEVVYLVDLITEALNTDENVKEEFVEQFLKESACSSDLFSDLKEYLLGLETKEMIIRTMSGLTHKQCENLGIDLHGDNGLYVLYPMPNLYFTRDSFASIGDGVSINHMKSQTRYRETIYGQYIFKHHPEYKDTKEWYDRDEKYTVEGGDIIVISDELILIGNSQRTDGEGIELIAKNILSDESNNFKYILELNIDKKRAFMHLDTVMTQLDENSFLIHPEILENMKINVLTNEQGNITKESLDFTLEEALKKYMNIDNVNFYYCGGDDKIASKREQWSDGSNVVTLAPGKVIAYKRNFITNKILKDAGFTVLELDASNLSMGRGGPRCMSMPLEREEI